jgi:hypothetical protein
MHEKSKLIGITKDLRRHFSFLLLIKKKLIGIAQGSQVSTLK